MAKLWAVRVVVPATMYVYAASEAEARATAESVLPRTEPPYNSLTTTDGGSIPLDPKRVEVSGVEAVRADTLTADDLDSLPWGDEEERTVGEIMSGE